MRPFIRFRSRLFVMLVIAGLMAASGACVVDAPRGQKAVLVTGASSGIGRAIAERLASEGHIVYAGARKQADIDELNAIENIEAVRLDVTIQEQIDAAVTTIRKRGRGLYGIVNNAGVITVGALHEIPEEDLQFQFDVNVYGVYRVTKAFMPLVAESGGRVVNIGAVTGILADPVTGAYSMSKHAIEAYTDSLAGSVAELGVDVSVIEPGRFESNIVTSMVSRMEARHYSAAGKTHEATIRHILDTQGSQPEARPPDAVADAVLHALFDSRPSRRYLVAQNERTAERAIRTQIDKLVQLNAGHDYSYDRDALIAMLDDALTAQGN